MKYEVAVKLRKNILPISPTRRTLAKMGFTAFTRNAITNQWSSNDDHPKVATTSDSVAENWYLYNGSNLPEHIFTFLREYRQNIKYYKIEYKE